MALSSRLLRRSFHDQNCCSNCRHIVRHAVMLRIYSHLPVQTMNHAIASGQLIRISDRSDWIRSMVFHANRFHNCPANCLNCLILPWLGCWIFFPFCLLRCLHCPMCRQTNLSKNRSIPVSCTVCLMLRIFQGRSSTLHVDVMANGPAFDVPSAYFWMEKRGFIIKSGFIFSKHLDWQFYLSLSRAYSHI